MMDRSGSFRQPTLIDILDKVLDKGLVVAGDIKVSLANVELLTIQVRLLVCSIDKAQEIGLDWWRHDRFLSSGANPSSDALLALDARLAAIEQRLLQVPLNTSDPAEERPRGSETNSSPLLEEEGTHGG
jgi:hypothetical protein